MYGKRPYSARVPKVLTFCRRENESRNTRVRLLVWAKIAAIPEKAQETAGILATCDRQYLFSARIDKHVNGVIDDRLVENGRRCLFVTRVRGLERLPVPPTRTTPHRIVPSLRDVPQRQ